MKMPIYDLVITINPKVLDPKNGAKNGKIETFKLHLLGQWLDFKIIHRNVPWVTLYQNC